MLNQIVNFNGIKSIAKVSLNLTVIGHQKRTFIQGEDGNISFQAANWQNGRNVWTFQPVIHWAESNNWTSSGTSVSNRFQDEYFSSSSESLSQAPYLSYFLYADEEGSYDIWCYGYSNGSLYYTWNDENVTPFTINADIKPKWQKIGSVIVEEPNVYTFSVYLSDTTIVVLDQWYITKNTNLESEFNSSPSLYTTPITLSKSPFNTAVRLRSLYQEELDDLENPYNPNSQSITSWLPNVNVSGKYNYTVQNTEDLSGINFEDGVSVDFWQIGGDDSFFCAWNYTFATSSIGDASLTTIPNVS